MAKREKHKAHEVKTTGPITVIRNEPPQMYLREELMQGEGGGRTFSVCLPAPPTCILFDVKDADGEAQYLIRIEELVNQVGAIRDGWLARAKGETNGDAGQRRRELVDTATSQAQADSPVAELIAAAVNLLDDDQIARLHGRYFPAAPLFADKNAKSLAALAVMRGAAKKAELE